MLIPSSEPSGQDALMMVAGYILLEKTLFGKRKLSQPS
jgi:hypothetical protein